MLCIFAALNSASLVGFGETISKAPLDKDRENEEMKKKQQAAAGRGAGVVPQESAPKPA